MTTRKAKEIFKCEFCEFKSCSLLGRSKHQNENHEVKTKRFGQKPDNFRFWSKQKQEKWREDLEKRKNAITSKVPQLKTEQKSDTEEIKG